MKNTGFKILFFINIFLVLADLISTLLNGELIKYLEVNPLYKYRGLTLILIVNLFVFLYFWWAYNRKKVKIDDRYFVLLILCLMIGLRCMAIYGNLSVAYVEPQNIAEHYNITYEQAKLVQLEYAKNVTEQQKIDYSINFIMPNLLPIICFILAYYMFKIDHKIKIKDNVKEKRI